VPVARGKRSLLYRAVIGQGLGMPKIIDILLEEHRNIEKLLLVLEHELKVFDRSGRPDYEILQLIIQYFQDYPESCQQETEEARLTMIQTQH
jgi:hemerythrin-like domain-containing protein